MQQFSPKVASFSLTSVNHYLVPHPVPYFLHRVKSIGTPQYLVVGKLPLFIFISLFYFGMVGGVGGLLHSFAVHCEKIYPAPQH